MCRVRNRSAHLRIVPAPTRHPAASSSPTRAPVLAAPTAAPTPAAPPPTTRTSYLSFIIISFALDVFSDDLAILTGHGDRRHGVALRMNPTPRTVRIIGDSFGPLSLRRSRPMCTSTRFVSGKNL